MPTTYSTCLESMFKLQRFGIKLGLETISHMLETLGNPHKNFLSIHIAGTNGKGSVAAMLTSILKHSGYKVGCYTSPHLEKFNERITINNVPINDAEVVAAYERVNSVPELSRSATFFEFATAMAFSEFDRQGVDWAVIETGMGGRLDATNILTPKLAIITNISIEHRAYLGNSISAIAGEKAGIIKQGVPVVTGVHQPSAIKAVADKAHSLNTQVYRSGHSFKTHRIPKGNKFNYFGLSQTWRNIELGLQGLHQIDNAGLALAGCEIINQNNDADLTEASIRTGLKQTTWPGRLEIVNQTPCIILDGAHNLMSARMLGRYLSDNFADRKITLVIGILDDKPYQSILKDLTTPCHRVIITQPRINRALPTAKLAESLSSIGVSPHVIEDVSQAVKFAIDNSAPNDVICVAGSLYVVGEAKTALKELKLHA